MLATQTTRPPAERSKAAWDFERGDDIVPGRTMQALLGGGERYEAYVMAGVRDVGHSVLPCNWLQIMENSVDPYHVEALHGDYFAYIAEWKGFEMPSAFKNKHVKVGFDAFEHGIIKRRQLVGQTEEDDDWAIGHPLVMPHTMYVGGNGIYQMQIRVPIDDTHTWALFYSVHAPEGADLVEQMYPVDYEYEWTNDKGEFIVDYIEGQDIMAWVSQGPIADRTVELEELIRGRARQMVAEVARRESFDAVTEFGDARLWSETTRFDVRDGRY